MVVGGAVAIAVLCSSSRVVAGILVPKVLLVPSGPFAPRSEVLDSFAVTCNRPVLLCSLPLSSALLSVQLASMAGALAIAIGFCSGGPQDEAAVAGG